MPVAKLTMIGGLGAALIAAIPPVLDTLSSEHAVATPLPAQIEWSPYGEVEHVVPDGPRVTVSGRSADDVDRIVVGIGPRSSGGMYWTGPAAIHDGEWTALVPTDEGLPANYTMKVWYQTTGSERRLAALSVRFDPTPTPAPSPDDAAACAAQYGDACFTGPGWQAPSVYQQPQ